jgi:hypothetical protein
VAVVVVVAATVEVVANSTEGSASPEDNNGFGARGWRRKKAVLSTAFSV